MARKWRSCGLQSEPLTESQQEVTIERIQQLHRYQRRWSTALACVTFLAGFALLLPRHVSLSSELTISTSGWQFSMSPLLASLCCVSSATVSLVLRNATIVRIYLRICSTFASVLCIVELVSLCHSYFIGEHPRSINDELLSALRSILSLSPLALLLSDRSAHVSKADISLLERLRYSFKDV